MSARWLLPLLVLLVAACAPAPAPRAETLAPATAREAETPAPATARRAETPAPATAPAATPGVAVTQKPAQSGPRDALVERARADASTRSGVAVARVQVVQVEEREWRDASLGCPAPGNLYAQVLTPGYLIVLDAGGRQFEYHTDRGSRLVLCQGGRPA